MTDFKEDTLPDQFDPYNLNWLAALTTEHEWVVLLDYDNPIGKIGTKQPVYVIAKCPNEDFANYIAHFHNMLLRGAKMLRQAPADLLAQYAGTTNPFTGQPARNHSETPPETGGYL